MKNNIRVCLVIGLFLLIFTVCYFVIPYPYENNTVFTLGYIFAIIAFLAQIYTLYKGLMKDSSLKSKVYGLPLIRVGFIYLAVQVIITLLLNIINAFVYLPSWICIVLHNILIILFLHHQYILLNLMIKSNDFIFFFFNFHFVKYSICNFQWFGCDYSIS